MSGGFFRGTSADQDTRFSNKTAKLLKTQKFAPELDQLIDMSKIKMDTLRPWIATRVTQFLGFEDEVLINFIYELLEGKNVDGKQIQIQLTGFMEKNTGKFMKELWGLLMSAQNTASGIPQQLLDEKAEEARQKKAEEHRIISEVRKKEDEKRVLQQELVKKEVASVEVEKMPSLTVPKPRSNSLSRGGKSPDGDRRNGKMDSRRPASRSRSGSPISSKSVSRSPRPASKRRLSHSVSRSPRRFRRSRSPLRRGRSPNYGHRSRSPPRRAWSPIKTRSPRRRRRSYSRSPRGRSPVASAHSPRRRRSPQLSYSPRGRSPNARSPRRHRSSVFTRSSPRKRKSPPRSPRYHRRSPRYVHSPVRRKMSPLARRRQIVVSPQCRSDSSPRRHPHISFPRRGSPSPRRMSRSLSPEVFSKSPQLRDSSGSAQRHSSTSPPCQPTRKLSPAWHNTGSVSSPQQHIPPSKGRVSKSSLSPIQQPKLPAYQQHFSQTPSPVLYTVKSVSKAADSPPHGTHGVAVGQHSRLSPSVSPRIERRSPGLSKASPPQQRRHSRSPLASSKGYTKDRPGQWTQKTYERLPMNDASKKRRRSASRESSLLDEDGEGALLKKSSLSDANAGVPSVVNHQSRKVDEAICSVSKSSSDEQHPCSGGKWRNMKDVESGRNEDHGTPSPVGLDDRKTAKRRRKEERRLRKEEKRKKREERHKRKEEKRANRFLSIGIASVTPPPDFNKCTSRSDDFASPDRRKGEDEDMEIEQMKLENELRRKALDSIKAKKVASS